MRIIPTKVHGVLDYLSAVTAIALPYIFGWSTWTTWLLTFLGLGILVYSAITQYELSFVKIVPMKIHLFLDALGGLVLVASAFMLANISQVEMMTLLGLGVMELGVTMLTKTDPSFVPGRLGTQR